MEENKFDRRKRYTLFMDNEIFKRNDVSLSAKATLATLYALDIDEMYWNDEISDSDGLIELLQKVCFEQKEEIIKALYELYVLGYLEWDICDSNYSVMYDTSELFEIHGKLNRNDLELEIDKCMSRDSYKLGGL